jgi:hypothetical protein
LLLEAARIAPRQHLLRGARRSTARPWTWESYRLRLEGGPRCDRQLWRTSKRNDGGSRPRSRTTRRRSKETQEFASIREWTAAGVTLALIRMITRPRLLVPVTTSRNCCSGSERGPRWSDLCLIRSIETAARTEVGTQSPGQSRDVIAPSPSTSDSTLLADWDGGPRGPARWRRRSPPWRRCSSSINDAGVDLAVRRRGPAERPAFSSPSGRQARQHRRDPQLAEIHPEHLGMGGDAVHVGPSGVPLTSGMRVVVPRRRDRFCSPRATAGARALCGSGRAGARAAQRMPGAIPTSTAPCSGERPGGYCASEGHTPRRRGGPGVH